MPSKSIPIQFILDGGLASETAGGLSVIPEPVVSIPYLVKAENMVFSNSGSPRTVGGTKQILEIPDTILSLKPLPNANGEGNLMVISQTEISTYKVNDDESITKVFSLVSSFVDDPFPETAPWDMTIFENYATLMNSNGDGLHVILATPVLGSTLSPGAGNGINWTTPNIGARFSTVYQNRLWAASKENPSRLYYSDLNDITTNGLDTNFLDIDPGDGSEITGLHVFRDRLFVFKGPKKGSIHVISGKTPSTFARDIFSNTVGCVNHQAIVDFSSDVLFIDTNYNFRTLSTTEQFGDFETASLSSGLKEHLKNHVYEGNELQVSLTNDPANGRVWAKLPTSPGLGNNMQYVMDYNKGIKFTTCDWVMPNNLALIRAADTARPILIGDTENHITILDRENQEYVDKADGTKEPYKSIIQLPTIKFMPDLSHNTMSEIAVTLQGNHKTPNEDSTATECAPFDPSSNITLTWQRDKAAPETITITQSFGDRLASDCSGTELPTEGAFTLGTSRLSGVKSIETYKVLEALGEFRRIQFSFEINSINEGMQIRSFSATFGSDGLSTENL